MKRIIQVVFIMAFAFLIFLPVLFFNFSQTVSQQENRNLAPKPVFIKNKFLNKNIFSECDDYFQDHFGFREQLIFVNNKNPLKVEQSISNKQVLEGKDRWYFYLYGGNLKDFCKRNLLNSAELESFANKVKNTVAWCKEQNILCLFLICPNKHSVYEEYFPFDRPNGITRADQITKVFDELNVDYIFPRDFLISQKKNYDIPLYYEAGTHWNSLGSFIVYSLLKQKLSDFFPNIKFPEPNWKIASIDQTANDTVLFLAGLDPNLRLSSTTRFQIENGNISEYCSYIKNDGVNGVHTQGADKKLPRALIYRDSFFAALEPFVSPLFSEAEYIWKNFQEEDKNYVLQYKPDIIIFEVVERNAPTIVQ